MKTVAFSNDATRFVHAPPSRLFVKQKDPCENNFYKISLILSAQKTSLYAVKKQNFVEEFEKPPCAVPSNQQSSKEYMKLNQKRWGR